MDIKNKLVELIKNNPELPIVPMVHYDLIGDDDCTHWMGTFAKVEVGEYCIYHDRVYFFDDSKEEVWNYVADDVYSVHSDWTEQQIDNETAKITDELWTKAIIVWVE